MIDERDDQLLDWFEQSNRQLEGEEFVQQLMQQIHRREQVLKAVYGAVVVAAMAVSWLLAPWLGGLGARLSTLLNVSVFAIDNGWVYTVLAPANNLAALLVVGGFLLWAVWRKISSL